MRQLGEDWTWTHAAFDDSFGADEDHVDPLHDVRDGAIQNDGTRYPSRREDLMCAHPVAIQPVSRNTKVHVEEVSHPRQDGRASVTYTLTRLC